MSPSELLNIRERYWREDLENVSLVAEMLGQINPEHRDQTLGVLGGIVRRQPDKYLRERALRRWPAVQVVATVGVAVDHYANGTLWPRLAQIYGAPMDQAATREWGDAFLDNLKRLGLPVFDNGATEAGSKYVGRILMHSGMPTACLEDFFELVSSRRARVRGTSPAELVAWAASRAEQSQLKQVDVPVMRFFRYGGAYASDVTERTFELLDVVSAGDDASVVPLPARFAEVARRMSDHGALWPTSPRDAGSDQGDRPMLVIDPFGLGVLLRLPAVGEAPDGSAVWTVGLGDSVQRVTTRALDPDLREPAPQTDVPIPYPVRAVTAALATREDLVASVSVVDDQAPLLAFREDGLAHQAGAPLPASPTWLLFPGDSDQLVAAGATVLVDSPLPPGWSGWSMLLVDLTAAAQVSLVGSGFHRPVRKQASARIVVDDPVRGVRTSSAQPVVATLPRVVLPDGLEGAAWVVSVHDGGNRLVGRWASRDSVSGPDAVWDAVARPVVGTFTVKVRGPWGRGATRTVRIIEGLEADFSPSWRRFARGGLQPCVARLDVGSGVELARKELRFSPRDTEEYVRASGTGEHTTLVVSPPHMTVAHQSAVMTSTPSVRAASLRREALLEDPGTLIVDIGQDAEPTLFVRRPAGVLQEVAPGAARGGVYRFDLARILDTLRANPQVQLCLDPAGEIVVAEVRPQRLFSDIELSDDRLVLTDCVDVDGLVVIAFAARAPWRPPASIPVVSGEAVLPSWMRGSGPLRVVVRIDDAWAPEPVPEWPSTTESWLIETPGHVSDGDVEEIALSAYLAGTGDSLEGSQDFARLWAVRATLGGLALGARAGLVADEVDRLVSAAPRPALLALSASEARSPTIPSLVIRTGLAWADLRSEHDGNTPEWSSRGALPAALISASDHEWSDAELSAAVEVCGHEVLELIAGRDSSAAAGKLDDAAEVFDQAPAFRHTFVQQCGLVPKGLLSGDSRVLASMAFIEKRRDPDLEFLSRNCSSIHQDVDRVVALLRSPTLSAAIEARSPVHPRHDWLLVPAISLGLALVARRTARGLKGGPAWLERKKRVWGDLAKVVPQLVTIDLIVAELLVASLDTIDTVG